MTLDLIALSLLAFFAIWGAFSGFSRQVAHAIAGIGAVIAAAPAGRFFAEPMAKGLQSSLTVGVVVATIVSFLAVYLLVRLLMTLFLRRLLAGKDPKNRTADRTMGFGLGFAKTAVALWIGLSAATFVENNLVLAGRKYTFTPKDSKLVALARQYNFIETVQFSGAKDLVLAAKLARDPNAAQKLKDDPDYAALMKDSRFRQVLQTDGWKKALESGDVRGLMQNNQLVELIQDPKMNRHLERLAAQAD
ncbi:MAG: CvpA family protein [Archangium sp.]|nr:CvpA family protein [Archangium sp.]